MLTLIHSPIQPFGIIRLAILVGLLADTSPAAHAADARFAFADNAAVWIEAETAQPEPGLTVDSRKAGQASGGKVLGIHADRTNGVTASWEFHLSEELTQPELLIRHAGLSESHFQVSIGEKTIGAITLPRTSGWGTDANDWQWTLIRLPASLAATNHVLHLTAAARVPVNLDSLMFVEANRGFPGNLQVAQLTETTAARTSVKLAAWEVSPGWESVSEMSSSREGRTFLDENLPALLTRTLVLDTAELPKDELLWILTGPRAGLTVAIRRDSVELLARSYDSFGLHPDGTTKFPRFPESKRSLCQVRTVGVLKAVTLTLDHRASAELFLNGQSVYRGTFVEDLSRHQLRIASSTNAPRWCMLRPVVKPASVTVVPERTHQKILGWGGIASIPSYHLLSEAGQRQWWRLLCEYGLNIQREYPAGRTLNPDYSNLGSLQAAIHHYYDDNFPNGETVDFDYLRLHRRLPHSAVWFEYWWQLPPWTVGQPGEYAKSILEYCRRVKERSGRGPEVIGVQNEHLDEDWSKQVQALRTQLDAEGYAATRIHMNDAGRMKQGLDWLKQYRADAAAWKAVDYTASHQYDYQDAFTDPDKFDATLRQWRELSGDKPFLSTELCVNNSAWQVRSYRLAFQMAQHYHKTLTLADAVAVCYCWLLLDVEQPTFNWTRSLFAVDRENGFGPAPSSHQLRCYGAFSRRIRAGMTRIETRSDHPHLLASAYRDDAGKSTVVLLNRSTEPLSVSVNWPGARFNTVERVSQSQPNSVESAANFNPAIHIEPGSIATLTDLPLNTLPEGFWDAFHGIRGKR